MEKYIIGLILFTILYVTYLLQYYNIILGALYICVGELIYNHYRYSKNTYPADLAGLWVIINLIDNFANLKTVELFKIIAYVNFSDGIQQLIGKRYGTINPLPTISPNKTLEGYIGGLITSAFISYITEVNLIYYFTGVIGDLLYARIKRNLEIKDWSCILGSHGGMLDRFNSSIFSLNYFLTINK